MLLVIYAVKSSSAFLAAVFLFLLVLAPVVTSHNVGYNYSYKIYMKMSFEVEGVNLTDSPDPTKVVIVINGTTDSSITGLSEGSVSIRLRPNLTVSGEVEPSKFQQNLRELLNLINTEVNKVREASVPLSFIGYTLYGDPKYLLQIGINISWFSTPLNVTTARFTTWRGIPALQLEFEEVVTNTQQGYPSNVRVKVESYLDSTTFLILYFEGRATWNLSSPGGATANFLVEVKSELINVDAVKDLITRTYRVRFEEGESRVYVASEKLSVLSLNISGNDLLMKVGGAGFGGVTIFTPQNIKVHKILVDGKPVNYQILKCGNEDVIRVPLTLSEHEIRITYEKTIKSVEEVPVAQAGTNTLFSTLAIVVVLASIIALVALLVFLFKGKKSY